MALRDWPPGRIVLIWILTPLAALMLAITGLVAYAAVTTSQPPEGVYTTRYVIRGSTLYALAAAVLVSLAVLTGVWWRGRSARQSRPPAA